MSKLFLLLLCSLIASSCFGQKPPIDSTVYGKWPQLANDPGISNNGQYVFYYIQNQPVGGTTLEIASSDGSWKKDFMNARRAAFTINNDLIFFQRKDTLFSYRLGTNSYQASAGITDFEIPGENKTYLFYRSKPDPGVLHIRNVLNGVEWGIKDVSQYSYNEPKQVLVAEIKAGGRESTLRWVNLLTRKSTKIWSGQDPSAYAFDDSGNQLAFIGRKANGNGYTLWYYKRGMAQAVDLTGDRSAAVSPAFILDNAYTSFSKNGEHLFFSLKKAKLQDTTIKRPAPKRGSAGVNIWNYKDTYLQSEQLADGFFDQFAPKTQFYAVMHLRDRRIIRLDDDSTIVAGFHNNGYVLGATISAKKFFYDPRPDRYPILVSALNGAVTHFKKGLIFDQYPLSPEEKYVVWFDPDSAAYFSYDISTQTARNISKAVPDPLNDTLYVGGVKRPFGVVGWTGPDGGILVYGAYDIWLLDLRGAKPPVNLTNGLGRKNGIVFSYAEANFMHDGLIENEQLLLSGYDREKRNGFWKTNLKWLHADPQKCNMEPYSYFISRIGLGGTTPTVGAELTGGFRPLRAKNVPVYLVKRVSAEQAPNYLVTRDFIKFKQISSIAPQLHYNWLTAQLVSWKTGDGHHLEGILYKPENFDPAKKYPVIFTYYTKVSDGLREFMRPDYSFAILDIPTYVSNGYLVFYADINFPKDHTGEGVVGSIISAARELSRYPWVDSTRLGLMGHSFGGWETNFIVTHSHLFAAACEAAGVADQISSYGQLNGDGGIRERGYELGSQVEGYGIGVTPWARPDLYLENSPLFALDRVTTPLLMMHNSEDGAVPFAQGIEWFTGLKRAGKKVWLLQYDHEGHGLDNRSNQKDYTIRMRQFFDHYLKGLPPPRWMTIGVPAKLKGIDDGLELDTSGIQP